VRALSGWVQCTKFEAQYVPTVCIAACDNGLDSCCRITGNRSVPSLLAVDTAQVGKGRREHKLENHAGLDAGFVSNLWSATTCVSH
jgi:hypothetical protein